MQAPSQAVSPTSSAQMAEKQQATRPPWMGRSALTLLFDVPSAIGLDRRHAAASAINRLDKEPAEFHDRVRRRYLELAAAEPERWVVLDGAVSTDELEARGWEVLGPRLAHARA